MAGFFDYNKLTFSIPDLINCLPSGIMKTVIIFVFSLFKEAF